MFSLLRLQFLEGIELILVCFALKKLCIFNIKWYIWTKSSFYGFLGSHMRMCILEVSFDLLRSFGTGGVKPLGNGPLGLLVLELQDPSWSQTALSLLCLCARPQRLSLFWCPLLWGTAQTYSAPRVCALKPGSGSVMILPALSLFVFVCFVFNLKDLLLKYNVHKKSISNHKCTA